MRQIDRTYQEEQQPGQRLKQEGVRVGNLTVFMQQDEAAMNKRKQRLLAQSYCIHETQHFVICQVPSSHQTVLLHRFGQPDIDADLICFIEDELAPFHIISSAKEFGAALFAVLASTFPSPRDQRAIWRQFCLNTLTRLREQIFCSSRTPSSEVSYIAPFAGIYRRVFELFTGQSLLDVGCSFGFLPVLMAERANNISIVGCDNNPDAITFSADLAAAADTSQVHITLQDVIVEDFARLGCFDTVTAIHLLEHLNEQETLLALDHLLRATARRLIIAVPYEEVAKGSYGHQQVFTLERLHLLGNRCLETLGGTSRYWCEDVMGGMLVVERSSDESGDRNALP